MGLKNEKNNETLLGHAKARAAQVDAAKASNTKVGAMTTPLGRGIKRASK